MAPTKRTGNVVKRNLVPKRKPVPKKAAPQRRKPVPKDEPVFLIQSHFLEVVDRMTPSEWRRRVQTKKKWFGHVMGGFRR